MATEKKAGRPRLYDNVKCMFPQCDAPAKQHRLCRMHYTIWPYHMFLHGDKITERRIIRGYVEARVDGVWALEHRLLMTRKMGRLLEHSEIIQWKDGNTQNNDLENLVLTSRAEKARLAREAKEAASDVQP